MKFHNSICILIILFIQQFSPAYSQQNKVLNCNAPVNVGRLLLEGVKQDAIKMLKFDEFGGEATEIKVGDIRIHQEDFWGEEWDESIDYYLGDAIQYNGQVYESLIDLNKGNTPGRSDSWQIFEEVWSEIDDINSFFVEMNESSQPTYFHLYYQLIGDSQEDSRYLASFDASAAIKYLNELGLLWYETDELGHLVGSIFLDLSNDIFLQSAKLSGIDISENDLSFEGREDKWWSTLRNFALKENDMFRFLYYDDSIMWEVEATDYNKFGVEGNALFTLLGNAMANGKAFNSDLPIASDQVVSKIKTNITEQFPAFDQLYLINNGEKRKTAVALSDVSLAEWSEFVETILEGVRAGKMNAYASENMDSKLTVRDLDLRMMLYEDQAVELDVEQDQWKKTVTYYYEDKVVYAGILYQSLKENNVDHIPSQWPEYWDEVIVKMEYFYPDDLRIVKVKSELIADSNGKILSITPKAFGLEIPGRFNVTGLNKEIAWFDLNSIKSTNTVFNKIISKIKSHDFYAEMTSYEPLKTAQ